jgi:hypothetical protein
MHCKNGVNLTSVFLFSISTAMMLVTESIKNHGPQTEKVKRLLDNSAVILTVMTIFSILFKTEEVVYKITSLITFELIGRSAEILYEGDVMEGDLDAIIFIFIVSTILKRLSSKFQCECSICTIQPCFIFKSKNKGGCYT